MFGYVTIGRNHLSEEEYRVFSSYYCGVCRATGKKASQVSRLGLSYDITFMALLISSLFDEGEIKSGYCLVHPAKKREFTVDDRVVDYSAMAGVILTYLKLKDDWHDEKSLKALLGMFVFHGGLKKSRKSLSREYDVIEKQLKILSEYEKNNSNSIDDTADAFAKILEVLFTPDFIEDEKTKRKLSWLGYNLGRWIYIIDAVNDIEKDIKSQAYNPLVAMGYKSVEECREKMELDLTLALSSIASAFDLMDFKKNKDIIGKIIYLGLKDKQNQILNGQGKENK